MCDPTSALLAGTATQYVAQRQAANRARRAVRSASGRQDVYSGQIISDVEGNASQYDARDRLERVNQNQNEAAGRLTDYLAAAQERAGAGSSDGGGEAYQRARAARAVEDANFAGRLAKMLGKRQGLAGTRMDEAFANADSASRTATLADYARRMLGADQQTIGSVSQPSPALMLAGAMMRGYGQGQAYAQPAAAARTASMYQNPVWVRRDL